MARQDTADTVRIFKALSNPTRVEILGWLKNPGEYFSTQEHPLHLGVCAGQFERTGHSQSTVSSHLNVLQRADLVSTQRVGQWVFYRRNEKTIRQFIDFLERDL